MNPRDDLLSLPLLGVSAAVDVINQSLALSLPYIKVEGEVSGFKVSQGKWVFFDLKDDRSTLRCFSTVRSLAVQIEDGMLLKVGARPNLHNKYGFSLVIDTMQPSGEGSLKRALELTIKKLQKEGLFDASRKRPLPRFPERLALITSADAAAYSDVLKILTQRWPLLEVIHYDVYVQGDQAPASLIKAIEDMAAAEVLPDVAIITRGGGSLEDLAAFNNEQVARAVAASRVPTVVGVGHERDNTLADMVADVRATTPTNAAERATPDVNQISLEINQAPRKMITSYNNHLKDRRHQLIQATSRLASHSRQLLDWLQSSRQRLNSYDPVSILARGYAIIRDQKKQVVKNSSMTQRGDIIQAEVHQGAFRAEVQDVQESN